MTNLWWADTYDELSITLYSHEHYELYVLPHILGEGNIKQDKCVLHCCTTDMTTRPVGQSIATAATLVLSTVWVVIVVTAFYIWQRRIGTSTFIVREDQSNFSLILFFRILIKACWVSVWVRGSIGGDTQVLVVRLCAHLNKGDLPWPKWPKMEDGINIIKVKYLCN